MTVIFCLCGQRFETTLAHARHRVEEVLLAGGAGQGLPLDSASREKALAAYQDHGLWKIATAHVA